MSLLASPWPLTHGPPRDIRFSHTQLYPHFTPILSCNRESLEQLENRDQLAPRYVHVSPTVTQHSIAPPWGHRVTQLALKVLKGREGKSMLAPDRRRCSHDWTQSSPGQSGPAFSHGVELRGIL